MMLQRIRWLPVNVDSQRTRKRSTPDGHESQPSKPKRESCAKNAQEVEAIMEDLRKITRLYIFHRKTQCLGTSHTDAKTFPPNLPYFKLPKSKDKKAGETTACEEQTEDHQTSTSTTISPIKRVGLRSECIKQLDQWHSLLEKGGITKDQYDELQKTIFEDIRTNF